MKIDKAIKIQRQATSSVESMFHMAKIMGYNSSKLTQKYIEIKNNLPKNTPRYVYSYLNGIFDCRMNDLYKYDLEFCYIVNGKKYSIRKNSPDYYANHNISPKQLCNNMKFSGHYWIKTGKLFFGSDREA